MIDVPTVGRMQMMTDPQGAAFYIYEPSNTDRQPEGQAEIGEASWHELMTTDAPAALKFYTEVFGWQPSEAMDMGPMGKYHMFNRPHGMIGGMMNKPPEMAHVPPNWQIYFRVPDINAAVERIKANGGKILNGPMEVPAVIGSSTPWIPRVLRSRFTRKRRISVSLGWRCAVTRTRSANGRSNWTTLGASCSISSAHHRNVKSPTTSPLTMSRNSR